MGQEYEQDPGADLVAAIKLIKIGIRSQDSETGRVGYERLIGLTGKQYAMNVVFVKQTHWEEEQKATECPSE